MTERARILLAITVYNGRDLVLAAVESACAIDTSTHDVNVLVLDDHSPDPGWSEELASVCAERSVRYYCTPRNLGIPRNVNLGLLAAHDGGYSHVLIANSDVLFPHNLVDRLIAASESDNSIASVTAWSNNAGIYSIPNDDPVACLRDLERVSWLSETLRDEYDDRTIDVPAGISFCILIPTWAVAEVGLMDPVFGRGYCEETDWTLRSQSLGYRCTVALGVFVYHAGQGSNETAGLLRQGATTVDQHEAIVDMRYPTFRADVGAYMASGMLDDLHAQCCLTICRSAAREFGYSVEMGRLSQSGSHIGPTIIIDTGDPDPVSVRYLGFNASLGLTGSPDEGDIGLLIREFGGGPPRDVNVLDRGPHTQDLVESLGGSTVDTPIYPARV